MIVKIGRKRYEWKPENMHPVLLYGGFLTAIAVFGFSLWSMCLIMYAVA